MKIKKYDLVLEEVEVKNLFCEDSIATTCLAGNIASRIIGNKAYENFIAVFLNPQNIILGYSEIGKGGVLSCNFDRFVLFKYCFEIGSQKIILIHNHPSGIIEPSKEDKVVLEEVKKGAELLGISVLDNLIVSGNKYFSFVEQGIF